MKNNNECTASVENKNSKGKWAAPKIIRRAQVDRTQGGISVYVVENVVYSPS